MQLKKIFVAGKIFIASKFSDYETGYYNFQAKLQIFFGSHGNDGDSVICGRKNLFARLNLNRRDFKFFLVYIFSGEVRSCSAKKFRAGKKNYADWHVAEACNGLYSFGSCGAHFDRTFFVNVGLLGNFLCCFALCFNLFRKEEFLKIFVEEVFCSL